MGRHIFVGNFFKHINSAVGGIFQLFTQKFPGGTDDKGKIFGDKFDIIHPEGLQMGADTKTQDAELCFFGLVKGVLDFGPGVGFFAVENVDPCFTDIFFVHIVELCHTGEPCTIRVLSPQIGGKMIFHSGFRSEKHRKNAVLLRTFPADDLDALGVVDTFVDPLI